MEIIKVDNLIYEYSEGLEEGAEPVRAIDGLSLEIEAGSFTAVIGRNGSGKSTFAKNLNALLLPSGGAVYVKGLSTADEGSVWEIREACAMVFQNPDNQLVSSVVEDDVAFGPENLGIPSEEIRIRVDEALEAVDMYEKRKLGPHLLSGGQKQRVAIAGVIAMRPECIVFDEPTAMLDPKGRAAVMRIIKKLHAEGKTIVLITHFMEEAAEAERVVIMEKGRIAMDGSAEEIFGDPEALRARGLDVPFAVSMREALKAEGIAVPADIVSEEGLVNFLCR